VTQSIHSSLRVEGTSDLRQAARDHLWLPYSPPGLQGRAGEDVRILDRAEGTRIWDIEGREYIDGISALEAMILEQGDEGIITAMAEQARRLTFLDVFRWAAPPQIQLAERLTSLAPGMQYAHFVPGGAEAVEAAVKIARQYHHLRGEPHRMKVITRQGSFHGVTQGAMALDGGYFASRNVIYDGGLSWGRTAPAPACHMCDFGKASRHLACVHTIERLISAESAETVAAVVMDPMASAIAVACPPDTYMRDLRTVCDEYGVLLVADEIITGMGRTGRLFAIEHSGITPDFVTLSKGLTSGYFPIAATLVAGHVAETFTSNDQTVFRHGHTYAGHPLGAAAALHVVDRVCSDRLWERAEASGRRLLEGLRSLDSHRFFWDARGRGMLLGLEIVQDGKTGVDFPDPVAAGSELRARCRDLGLISLILHPGNVLFLAPPLVTGDSDIDRIVAIVDQALTEMEAAWA
jgi:adenosylmethionine-8-amino-7-oxononanoate aminotransferase